MASGIHDQMGLGYPRSADLTSGRQGSGQSADYLAARRDPSFMSRAEASAPSRGPKMSGRSSSRVTAPWVAASMSVAIRGPTDPTDMAFRR